MSTIVEIAIAVVSELNGHDFSKPVEAIRYYKPAFDLKDMKDLHVSVVPRGVSFSTASRCLTQADVQIDVAIQQKLSSDAASEQAEIDALMDLVQEIADFLRQRRLAAAQDASWVGADNAPIYDPDHLDQLRQFTSVLTLTYRVLR